MPVVSLIVLAVMLILGGVGAMLIGTDSVVPDRPFAAAIGGAVALGSGCIVLGLALVLRELTSIRRALMLSEEAFTGDEDEADSSAFTARPAATATAAKDLGEAGPVRPPAPAPRETMPAPQGGDAPAAGSALAGAGALAAVAAAVGASVQAAPTAVPEPAAASGDRAVEPQAPLSGEDPPAPASDAAPASVVDLASPPDKPMAASEAVAETRDAPFDIEREFDLMLSDVAGAPSARMPEKIDTKPETESDDKPGSDFSADIESLWKVPADAAALPEDALDTAGASSSISAAERQELTALIEAAAQDTEPNATPDAPLQSQPDSAAADIAHVEEITRDLSAIPPVPSLEAMRESLVQDVRAASDVAGPIPPLVEEAIAPEPATADSAPVAADTPAPEPEEPAQPAPIIPPPAGGRGGFQWRRPSQSAWEKPAAAPPLLPEAAGDAATEVIAAPDSASAPDRPPPAPLAPAADTDAAHAGKTMIRTFSSGPNQYTMYSDGSISADTPSGRFEFASFTELREFIDNYKG